MSVGPRLRDEILSFFFFTLAVVVALPLIGLAEHTILASLTALLRYLIGIATYAAPFALAIVAVEIWNADQAAQRARRTIGGMMALASVIGLLTLSGPEKDVALTGGYLGKAIAFALELIVGEVGTALLLFSSGVIAVFLVTGNDVYSLRASWRRICSRHGGNLGEADRTDVTMTMLESDRPEGLNETSPITLQDPSPIHAPDRSTNLARKSPVIAMTEERTAVAEIRNAVVELESNVDDKGVQELGSTIWSLPPLTLLHQYSHSKPDAHDLEDKARRIEETLSSFNVEAAVREVFPGPAVTLFALEPGVGVKVSKITALQNDLALALAAPSIRIEAPVPGMARVGIEIPNRDIATVGLREVLESDEVKSTKARLPIPLGRDVNGRYVVADLTRMPHLLIAGATGSGKSVCINCIIATFLLTKTPDHLKLIMIDPKMVELVGYKNVPHLKGPIVTEMDKVVSVLRLVLKEMERRYQLFVKLGVRNIDGYNMRRDTDATLENLPYLVVIIDELADLMMTTPEEVETLLARLCQMARATGIHLIIATQRPSVDVLTGLIKANVPARISFAVTSLTDSRVILDLPGAERLIGGGDMLFLPPDAAKPVRVQGSYLDDQSLQKIVKHWRTIIPSPDYEPDWTEYESQESASVAQDALYEQAVEIVRQQGSASASMLQRRLRIGYNRAARIIESMEDEGLIGPADGSRSRVVIDYDEDLE